VATGKRYYWMKLRDTFMRSDAVDFLMGQKDGANYVVLYQMLCLMTINTDGKFSRTIGEVIIPYDVEKIQRDCKYFSIDTIRIALGLYQKLGLIYEDRDGTLVLSNYSDLIGTETDWSAKKRRQRDEARQALPSGDNVPTFVPTNVPQSVPIEIRDKILDTNVGGGDKDIKIPDNDVSTNIGNPYGDTDGPTPDFNTLEIYAANNLRAVTPYNLAELVSYRDDKEKPLPDALIRYAIDLACGNGKPFYNYVHSILERMKEQDIRTVGDAKAAEEEHRRRKQQKQQAKTTDPPELFGDFY